MASATLVSLADYLRSSYEPDAEYANGRIEERPMGERDHSDLQTQMLALLNESANRPFFLARAELRVQTTPTNYRIPDVCVLKAGTPREQTVLTPPLLCIEVLSPEDTMRRTMARVREFLAMGVPEVWVLDADRRSVQVCAGTLITEKRDGTLTVPGSTVVIAIADIFRILDET